MAVAVIVPLLLQLAEGRPPKSVQFDYKLFPLLVGHKINIYNNNMMLEKCRSGCFFLPASFPTPIWFPME